MAPERTEIPPLDEEPTDAVEDQVPDDQVARADVGPGRGRRRREPASEPDLSEPPPSERPGADSVTETQLVRAFYWLYRGWCRLLGAKVDAHHSDFQDLGKAWLDLARKVPGIRWVIAAAGPLFTLTDLIDKLALAWSARTRFRQGWRPLSWRQRSQEGQEQPDVHVVDGGDPRAS